MNRRRFLSITSASLATPFLPQSLSAFSGEAPADAALLSLAQQKARDAGRPLLCLVVPSGNGDRYQRGQVLGSWLHNTPDEGLLDLAVTDLVCASDQAIESLGVKLAKDPLPWMLHYPANGSTPQPITGSLPADPEYDSGDWEQYGKQCEDVSRERVKILTGWLRSALFDKSKLDVLATSAWSRVSAGDQARVDGWLKFPEGPTPDGSLVRAAAAMIRVRARGLPKESQEKALRVVIDQVIETERTSRPTGAKWAIDDGCGFEIEGEDMPYSIDCGMGFTPMTSRRFLYFYIHEPKDPFGFGDGG